MNHDELLKNLSTAKATIKIKDVTGDTHSETLHFPYSTTRYDSDAEYLKALNEEVGSQIEKGEGFVEYLSNNVKADKVVSYKVTRERSEAEK